MEFFGTPKPHTIVLSGGGIRALSHIGALEVLSAAGSLTNVKRWVGLSAGALVAFTMCIGYTLKEVHDICERIDFEIIQDLEEGLPFSFFDTYGVDTGQRLRKFLGALLTVRGFPITLTFAQLQSKYALQIYATNLSTGASSCFSKEMTPDTAIIDSLQASMALPIYFKPFIEPRTGHMMVDGGIMGFYPRSLLEPNVDDKGILGLLLIPKLNYNSPPETLQDYIWRIFNLFTESRNYEQYKQFRETSILIETDDISPVNFRLDDNTKRRFFTFGAEAATRYIERIRCRVCKGARRHSL